MAPCLYLCKWWFEQLTCFNDSQGHMTLIWNCWKQVNQKSIVDFVSSCYTYSLSESEFPSLSLVWLNYSVQIMDFTEKWMAVMSIVVFKILWITWAIKSESFRDEAQALYFLMSSSVTLVFTDVWEHCQEQQSLKCLVYKSSHEVWEEDIRIFLIYPKKDSKIKLS